MLDRDMFGSQQLLHNRLSVASYQGEGISPFIPMQEQVATRALAVAIGLIPSEGIMLALYPMPRLEWAGLPAAYTRLSRVSSPYITGENFIELAPQ